MLKNLNVNLLQPRQPFFPAARFQQAYQVDSGVMCRLETSTAEIVVHRIEFYQIAAGQLGIDLAGQGFADKRGAEPYLLGKFGECSGLLFRLWAEQPSFQVEFEGTARICLYCLTGILGIAFCVPAGLDYCSLDVVVWIFALQPSLLRIGHGISAGLRVVSDRAFTGFWLRRFNLFAGHSNFLLLSGYLICLEIYQKQCSFARNTSSHFNMLLIFQTNDLAA